MAAIRKFSFIAKPLPRKGSGWELTQKGGVRLSFNRFQLLRTLSVATETSPPMSGGKPILFSLMFSQVSGFRRKAGEFVGNRSAPKKRARRKFVRQSDTINSPTGVSITVKDKSEGTSVHRAIFT